MTTIVIKLGLKIDLAKESGLKLLGLTLVKSRKLEKKIFEILIFYMKRSRNNLCGYRL
jgi:hypothetical protein